jgi:hypothetical protein
MVESRGVESESVWEGKQESTVLCIITFLRDYRREFGLVIGFTEFLQNVTRNYSAVANSHILQFITARTKTPQSAISSLVVA